MRFSLAHVLEWEAVSAQGDPTASNGAGPASNHDPRTPAPVAHFQSTEARVTPSLSVPARADEAHDDPDLGFSTVTMSSLPNGWPPMRAGGLFIAVRGDRRDGHAFVANAFENGATAALVDHIPPDLEEAVASGRVRVFKLGRAHVPRTNIPSAPVNAATNALVVVDQAMGTVATLQQLAGWWRRRWGRRVVAVAGSVGKTTTKDLVTAVLSRQFRTHATTGNLNNELGLPITLLGLDGDHEIGVAEIGISAPGEMATFAEIASADVAIMTRIEAEHLEFLRDIDTVAFEEGVVVERLSATGTAILNADDAQVLAMARRTSAQVATYGLSPNAQTRADDIRSLGFDGVSFRLSHGGNSASVTLPLAGRHFVSAALAAASAGFAVGCSWESVIAGLESPQVAPRIRVKRPNDDLVVIDDSYNASPASCIAALDLLAEAEGSRVAILGDMLELGDATPDAHRTVGNYVPYRADALIAVGDASRATADAAMASGMARANIVWVPRAADAAGALDRWRRALGAPGRFTVLVKGSRGMRMELVTQDLDVPGTPTEGNRLGERS